MTSRDAPALRVAAFFPRAEDARAAIRALAAAGVAQERIAISEEGSGAGREGRLMWRALIRIVYWSIVGAVAGAVLGLVLALAAAGPSGTAGAIPQVVSWTIIGHLVLGMLAGYLLLADRSHRERLPGLRPRAQLTAGLAWRQLSVGRTLL